MSPGWLIKVYYNLKFVLSWSAFNQIAWLPFKLPFHDYSTTKQPFCSLRDLKEIGCIDICNTWTVQSGYWIIEDNQHSLKYAGLWRKRNPFLLHELSKWFLLIFHFSQTQPMCSVVYLGLLCKSYPLLSDHLYFLVGHRLL